MNKRKKGRSLGREKDQKKGLMKGLLVALIDNKKIITTLAKAKELKPFAEKTLTLAKRGLNDSERVAKIRILKKNLPQKSIQELFEVARVSKREGGYLRIIKLMSRKSDASPMAMIEWVDKPEIKKSEAKTVENETEKKKATTPTDKKSVVSEKKADKKEVIKQDA